MGLCPLPDLDGLRLRVHPPGHLPEPLLHRADLAFRDRQQPLCTKRDAVLVAQPSLEPLAPESEAGTTSRRQRLAQVAGVAADSIRRRARRVREVPEQVRVFELTERAGQVALDEGPHPVKRFGAELDEDTGRVLDVGLGRLDQPRCLPQLRHDTPSPLLERGVLEQRLTRQAGRQQLCIVLRVTLPGANLLQLEQPAPDLVGQHPPLELFLGRQTPGRDAVQSPREPAQLPRLRLDGRPREVLDPVVMDVYPVTRRCRRQALIQEVQILVGKVRQRFRRVHAVSTRRAPVTRPIVLAPQDPGGGESGPASERRY